MLRNKKMAQEKDLLIFAGTDDYRIKASVSSAIDEYTSPESSAFDFERVSAKQLKTDQLTSLLATPPMMAEKRVVRVDDSESLSKSTASLIVKEIESLRAQGSSAHLLLLVYGPGKKPPAALRKIASNVSQQKKPRFRETEAWLTQYARSEHNKRLTSSSAQALLRTIGHTDQGRLAREVDRIATFAGKGEITPSLITESLGEKVGYSVFDLTDSVGEKNFPAAQRIAGYLASKGDPHPLVVMNLLTTHVLKLGEVLERQAEGESSGSIAKDMNPFGEKVVSQARNWSTAEIHGALSTILRADVDIKRGGAEDKSIPLLLTRLSGSMARSPARSR